MKLLAFLFRYSKGTIIVAIVVGVLSGACSAALMALINSSLVVGRASAEVLAWRFAGLVAAVLVTSYVSRAVLLRLSEDATFELRARLCRQVLEAPLRKLEEIGAHRIVAALTQDIGVITSALLNIPLVCINLAVLLGCMVYLGWLSPRVLGVLVVFLLVSVVSVELLQRRGIHYMKLAREEWDKLVKHIRSMTEGTKELKLHRERREAFFTELLDATARARRDYDHRGRTIHAVATSWSQVLYFIFIGIVLFALPAFGQLSLATLSGYVITVLYMRAPIVLLLDIVPAFRNANISLQKVEEISVSLNELVARGRAAPPPAARRPFQRLDLDAVTHTFYREHEERHFTLGPIDLTLRPGELVFLIGGNGSGKTTLAKLLTGLYAPETGEVRLNGEPVTEETRDEYRQLFSVVFSDFYLFEQLLGIGGDDLDARARAYLSLLRLDHKVEVKDGALSTLELSQGQRKRLALLTAYLEDRPVYVFDEWAADQDYEFKNIFYLRLLPELKARGKTVLVISHDDRFYAVADRLVKLDYGKLVDDPALEAHGELPSGLAATLDRRAAS
jgi:putative ATP-binding cassette transporter